MYSYKNNFTESQTHTILRMAEVIAMIRLQCLRNDQSPVIENCESWRIWIVVLLLQRLVVARNVTYVKEVWTKINNDVHFCLLQTSKHDPKFRKAISLFSILIVQFILKVRIHHAIYLTNLQISPKWLLGSAYRPTDSRLLNFCITQLLNPLALSPSGAALSKEIRPNNNIMQYTVEKYILSTRNNKTIDNTTRLNRRLGELGLVNLSAHGSEDTCPHYYSTTTHSFYDHWGDMCRTNAINYWNMTATVRDFQQSNVKSRYQMQNIKGMPRWWTTRRKSMDMTKQTTK